MAAARSDGISNSNSIVALYRRRMDDSGERRDRLARRANGISHARVVAFLAAAACLLEGALGESAGAAWLVAGGLLAIGFLLLVGLHRRVLAESERFAELSRINAQGAAQVLRNWSGIPLREARPPREEEALAGDLDLFGHGSLFHLISTANTPPGIETLSDWLVHPADPAVVLRRQEAAAELAPMLDMRQELNRRGLKVPAGEAGLRGFLHWAEGEPWLARRPWLKWASRCLPLVIVAGAVLAGMDVLPPSAWLIPLMANTVVSFVFCRQMHEIFAAVSTRHGEVGHYAGLFQRIAQTPVTCDCLAQLQNDTAAPGRQAWREVGWLGRIMDLANLRFSSMAYLLVQPVVSWDFHVLALLERWQRRNGKRVRRWFEALGQWEALASLAALAHDNPAWAFPVIEDQPTAEHTVRARALGHPLIADDRRVANDVAVGPPGTFLMVTGSNMSGKSTLLRSVGTNIVLAQAGAPVCAAELTMPPILLATSMRVRDSLAEGVSYYLAELRRLKQVVDAARRRPADSNRTLLYLLDEILQGTNTAERQIAVRRVVTHLLGQGAIGAVSTHDLELAAEPALAEASRTVHFRETIRSDGGRHEMTFDYKLRDGPATTSNALKLLEMVGLDDA